MRLLVLSMVFPNREEPHYGVFVKERLRLFREAYDVPITVVAPVPWAPPVGPERWQRFRRVPTEESIDGFRILHPRFASPPGFGDRWRSAMMARGVQACLRNELDSDSDTILDAHFAWPDGVAASLVRPSLEAHIGRRVPLVVTVRGTDVNLMPQQPGVRPRLCRGLGQADHVICVAEALREVVLELGVPSDRVTTLRNGVDAERFSPGDAVQARREVGLRTERSVILCVGHLTPRKGQELLIESFSQIRSVRDGGELSGSILVFVGDGEQRGDLERHCHRLGLEDDVLFTGAVEPETLPHWYRAADVLVLPSRREGWPNVVLEALACGVPVIATRVWGTPEIIEGCSAGALVDPTVEGILEGLSTFSSLDRTVARSWAERHSWDSTLAGMDKIFQEVIKE